MPQTADFTYDREADCFVVTDGAGNEICRTKTQHIQHHKTLVSFIVSAINDGTLIFPTALKESKPFTVECHSRYKMSRGGFERCPEGDRKFSTEKEAQAWIHQNNRHNPNSDTDYEYILVLPPPAKA